MGIDDQFLGGIKFRPNFDLDQMQDEWYEVSAGNGQVQVAYQFEAEIVRQLNGCCQHRLTC